MIREHEEQFIEPKGDAIRAMLPKDRPCVILMDEIISYVSTYRKRGYGARLYNFLDALGETARGEKNVAVVASIPASELEYTADDVADEQRFKKMLDRLGKAILMSAEAEIHEIIRRRLFEWAGMPDDGRKTARAYAEWAIEHAAELAGIDADTAYEKFQACYPFHPSVLSVFERKWQSLPRFQRTRGILRLLALWVAHAYQEEHRKAAREPLITFGSAPLEDPVFRVAMFEELGSDDLETPVTTDIAGKSDAHAVRLDKEAPEAIRKANLHRKVASTIFFESNGGMSRSKAEATLPEIKTGVGAPELNLVDVDNVLEELVSTCFYLNWDRNRYRFGLTPNQNQILVVRRGAVQAKAIEERVKKDTEKLFGEGSKDIDRRFWPNRSNDVPNRPVLTLVVLGLDSPAGEPATMWLMESIVRDCGTSGRTYKSALIFTAPESAESIPEAARTCLAWEDIDDDEETVGQLDEAQKRLLARNLGRSRSDLKESLWRAHHRLYLLGKDNNLREIDLGQITSSMASNIVELILHELSRSDEITPGVGPTKLVKYWPPALSEWSTKGVRDAFYSSPQLPRLLQPEAVKRTIADGVTQGVFGYAHKDEHGQLLLDRFSESLSEAEVEIGDEVFLLRAEDAKKLLERFYPGAAYVDISGIDVYGVDFKTADQKYWDYYRTMSQVSPGKMLACGECDAIPDPNLMQQGTLPKWIYALPWWGAPSRRRPADWALMTMRHDFIVTLDQLPAFGEGNIAPHVGILSPLDDGSAWFVDEPVQIKAYAVDRDGKLERVEFYAGDKLLGADEIAPYEFSWNDAPPGCHDVTTVAIDDAGEKTRSNTVRMSVGLVDLARGKKVVASSGESPQNAVDGDYYSMWSSANSDDEWIYVDLGDTYRIDRVNLLWGWKIHPANFAIDVAVRDPETPGRWMEVFSATDRPYVTWEATDRARFTATAARYVRLRATRRAGNQTWAGYQLAAMEVPVTREVADNRP